MRKFEQYFVETAPTRNVYMWDAPKDYIADTLRTSAVVANLATPVYRDPNFGHNFISYRTQILFVLLHKLNVRPAL